MDKNELDDLKTRVEKLEKAVFGDNKKAVRTKKQTYDGPKGGILLLVEKGALNSPTAASHIHKLLEENNYHYRIQVVQTALNRLAVSRGPLTAYKKDGKKVYVIRK